MSKNKLDLFAIFKCTKLNDLQRLMTSGAVLQADDFIRFVNATTSERNLPLRCRSICRLLPSDWDIDLVLSDIAAKKVKPGKIAKLAGQLDRHNRLHLHMFWLEGSPAWWAFLFDLRDLSAIEQSQHWTGSHIHLTTCLSHPSKTKEWVLNKMENNDKPKFTHDFHIRFEGNIGQDMRFG